MDGLLKHPNQIARRGNGMFRITRTDFPKHILLVIEGQLVGEDLGVIEKACMEALSTHASAIFLFKEITEVDANGRAFLRRLMKTNARIRALGIYSRYLVRRLACGDELPCIR
jgi:hypothetical protein